MKKCFAKDLEAALAKESECQVIDVREPAEFESTHIPGTMNLPLSNFSKNKDRLDSRKSVYILCASGIRASQAAEVLEKTGHPNVYVVEGGLKSWMAEKKPVQTGASKVWSVERQMRFVAGTMVLTGIVLSYGVNPYFLLISAFVAAGLIYSALTGTCGMVALLCRMPWNQSKGRTQA